MDGTIALFALAIGLAADAFALSVAQGACARHTIGHALRLGAAFGLAQAVMPLIGWALGVAFVDLIRQADHWIALVLLSFLGAKMIREALSGDAPEAGPALAGTALWAAALATSIDALAAGITLPTLGLNVAVACAVIGAVTFATCAAGVLIGKAAGLRLGRWAEIAGGLVLIALGVRIFVEHQFLGG